MRHDILKTIKDARDVTNALILTHNIDFVFVQSVVVPALAKCGSPKLTIFADAECAAQTYQYQSQVLSSLGRRYRVVPVQMQVGFRFHPKALMLSGPDAATLLVGSGNLTFGGWRENGEVWCKFDSQAEENDVFGDFYSYVLQVVDLCAQPRDAILAEVEEAFDSNTRSWAANLPTAGRLLGRAGEGPSMLQQIKASIATDEVEHLYICAPYFDEDAEAVRTISQELNVDSTTLLLESKRTNLLSAAAAGLGPRFKLRSATYEHKETANTDDRSPSRSAPLHAKFYGVQHDGRVTVFLGSANCSRSALTIPGRRGNSELMARIAMSVDEFQSELLNEIVVQGNEPVLPSEAPNPPSAGDETVFIRVHAARMELDHIRVTFQASTGTAVLRALFDGVAIDPVEFGQDWALFKTNQHPSILILVGRHNDAEMRSLPHWIDDERALRDSARTRSLAGSIQDKVRPETWGIGAWKDVLSELYRHLQYIPPVTTIRSPHIPEGREAQTGPVEFEWSDVFSDGYGLPTGSRAATRLSGHIEDRVDSLRAMLLRYFGFTQTEPREDTERRDADVDLPDTVPPDDDDGSPVDTVVPLPKALPRSDTSTVTERQRRRTLTVVKQVVSKLAEPDFLTKRPLEVLSGDLKVLAILLRAGLADEWLTDQEYFKSVSGVWLALFFNDAGTQDDGWLEWRFRTAPDQKAFVDAIRSAELAAALGCLALSTPERATTLEHVRFELASALSVARFPWLWQDGGNEQISHEITELLRHTVRGDSLDWKSVERRWLSLVRRGRALQRLESAIRRIGIANLRSRIRQTNVAAGDLLWQHPHGFCVAKEDRDRASRQSGPVLRLQHGDTEQRFIGPYLTPVAGLLEKGLLSDDVMPARERRELVLLVENVKIKPSSIR